MNNPFANAGAPVSGDDYVVHGDAQYRVVLDNALSISPVPSVVYGLPGTGKTSMAYRLRGDLRERRVETEFIDMSNLSRSEKAVEELRSRICRVLSQKVKGSSYAIGSDPLRAALLAAKRQGLHYVFILNHLCAHFHTHYRDDFYNAIVSLITDIGDTDCQGAVHLVCFSRRSPEMIQRKTGGSFLAGKCRPFAIVPFNAEEIGNLVRLSPVPVDPAELLLLSGGFPLRAAMLLREVNSGATDLAAARLRLGRSYNQCYKYVLRFFQDFFKEEGDLPSNLRKIGIESGLDCLLWRERHRLRLPQEVEEELEAYGLGSGRLPDELKTLSLFLESTTVDVAPLLLKLSRLEKDLRRLIDRELSSYYGTKRWFEECLEILPEENWASYEKKDGVKRRRDIKAQLIQWRDNAVKADPEASANILDYAYPDDLYGLARTIVRHWVPDEKRGWKGLGSLFENDAVAFDRAMSAFGDIRNPAHHCRQIPIRIEKDFEQNFMFLRRCLDEALAND